MLLTWHNVQYYQDLMRGLRDAILSGRFAAQAAALDAGWRAGDDAAPDDPAAESLAEDREAVR